MGFPFLLPALRFAKCMIREYRFPRIVISKTPYPRIVISSGSEKSFSFAIDQEK